MSVDPPRSSSDVSAEALAKGEAVAHQTSNPLDFVESAFFKTLTEFPFVDAIYVFGSRARGTATPRSDIDLAILCPEASDEEWRQVKQVVETADIFLMVDATRWDTLPKRSAFRNSVQRERVPVFLRRHTTYLETMPEFLAMMEWNVKNLREIMQQSFPSVDQKHRAQAMHFQRSFRYLWRVCRRCLIVYGIRTHSPLSTFKHAFAEGWLPERKLWESMYRDWLNYLPDDTPETLAALNNHLPRYVDAMSEMLVTLRRAMDDAGDAPLPKLTAASRPAKKVKPHA